MATAMVTVMATVMVMEKDMDMAMEEDMDMAMDNILLVMAKRNIEEVSEGMAKQKKRKQRMLKKRINHKDVNVICCTIFV